MVTLGPCGFTAKAISSNIHICNKTQRVFTDTSLGPFKVKRFIVALLTAEHGVHWFAHVVLLFQLHVSGAIAWPKQFGFIWYFHVDPFHKGKHFLDCIGFR